MTTLGIILRRIQIQVVEQVFEKKVYEQDK